MHALWFDLILLNEIIFIEQMTFRFLDLQAMGETWLFETVPVEHF